MNFDEYRTMIEKALAAALPSERPAALCAAMAYATGAGGKRIRPVLCLASAEAAGGAAADALMPACAIEFLHNYTLVHDDLPSMDNDTERRGQPSVWAKFGEAQAILAGDALQALAFACAAKAPRNAAAVVAELAARGLGVVCGQVEDIAREASPAAADIPYVYEHKTADLFMAAAVMGGLAGGGSEAAVAQLRRYARALGLAFQYEDDLLDGDSPYGRDETERLVRTLTDEAIAALEGLPGDTSFLRGLADRLVGRTA